jgi:hypothetical protein
MNGTGIETLPRTWDADRDEPFFHLVAAVFAASFIAGASCLLASYDVDGPAAALVT